LIHNQHFDCLVSNYVMPRMNCLELYKVLRAEGCDVPFILFTCLDDEGVANRAHVMGVESYILKSSSLEVYNLLVQSVVSLVSAKMSIRG